MAESQPRPKPFHEACEKGELDRLKRLVKEHGPSIVQEAAPGKVSPLHFAVGKKSKGDPDSVQFLLVHKADPNARDGNLNSPVHFAAYFKKFAALKVLLNNGGDPNIRGQHDNTPLLWALRGGDNPHVLQLLLIKGANPGLVNHKKEGVRGMALELKRVACLEFLDWWEDEGKKAFQGVGSEQGNDTTEAARLSRQLGQANETAAAQGLQIAALQRKIQLLDPFKGEAEVLRQQLEAHTAETSRLKADLEAKEREIQGLKEQSSNQQPLANGPSSPPPAALERELQEECGELDARIAALVPQVADAKSKTAVTALNLQLVLLTRRHRRTLRHLALLRHGAEHAAQTQEDAAQKLEEALRQAEPDKWIKVGEVWGWRPTSDDLGLTTADESRLLEVLTASQNEGLEAKVAAMQAAFATLQRQVSEVKPVLEGGRPASATPPTPTTPRPSPPPGKPSWTPTRPSWTPPAAKTPSPTPPPPAKKGPLPLSATPHHPFLQSLVSPKKISVLGLSAQPPPAQEQRRKTIHSLPSATLAELDSAIQKKVQAAAPKPAESKPASARTIAIAESRMAPEVELDPDVVAKMADTSTSSSDFRRQFPDAPLPFKPVQTDRQVGPDHILE